MIRASRRRLLPPTPEKRLSIWWLSFWSAVPDGLGCFFHTSLISLVVHGLIFLGWLEGKRQRRKMRTIVASRTGESICTYARQFDYRRLDTQTMRATFEELQPWMISREEIFPFRASDRFEEDLHFDGEDLDMMAYDIARRCQRSMENVESNPYFGSVKTVHDLVLFLNHQPKLV